MPLSGFLYSSRTLLQSHVVLVIIAVFIFTIAGQTQEQHRFTADVGGGVSPLTGAISDKLNTGWNFTASGGYNFSSCFSTSVRYTYNGFGIARSVLTEAQVPDGNARLWSVTAEPRLRLSKGESAIAPYLVGGVGYFRRTIEFTQPTVATTVLFDPIFGFLFPALVPVDQVIGRISRSGIGGNAGFGMEARLGHTGLKLFGEARYQYADTGRIPTRMVPITFGIRW
jgi:hypothetical protein